MQRVFRHSERSETLAANTDAISHEARLVGHVVGAVAGVLRRLGRLVWVAAFFVAAIVVLMVILAAGGAAVGAVVALPFALFLGLHAIQQGALIGMALAVFIVGPVAFDDTKDALRDFEEWFQRRRDRRIRARPAAARQAAASRDEREDA